MPLLLGQEVNHRPRVGSVLCIGSRVGTQNVLAERPIRGTVAAHPPARKAVREGNTDAQGCENPALRRAP